MRTATLGPKARLFRPNSLALALAAALPFSALAAYTVTNNGDNGGVNPAPGAATGTLRQALVDANANCATDQAPTINFSGPLQVNVSSQLPPLYCASNSFSPTVDGQSQATIEGGALMSYSYCLLEQSYSSYGGTLAVRGMKLQNYQYGTGICGYDLDIRNNIIVGNEIGIDISKNAYVGGTVGDRNIIGGNLYAGITVAYGGGPTANVQISGNYIGTDPSGAVAHPNHVGIYVVSFNAQSILINDNVISGNDLLGVLLESPGVQVVNNKIGLSAGGGALGNGGPGIDLYLGCCIMPPSMMLKKGVPTTYTARKNGLRKPSIAMRKPSVAFNKIAGFGADISGNQIAHNGDSGVYVEYGGGVKISQNSIHSNAWKNIDLDPYGGASPTPIANDALDTDGGPNGWQNHPVVNSFTVAYGGGTTINYSLNSNPGTAFVIEFFANSAMGAPAGQSFLGSVTATTDSYGGVIGTTPSFPGSVSYVSATARNAITNDTSEFSPIVSITPTPSVTVSSTMLDFGSVPIGTSGTLTSNFTSQGTAPWLVTSAGSPTCYGGPAFYGGPIACGGPFTCTSNCSSGSPYSAGSGCFVTASFTPAALGPFSASLQICDNTTGSPRTISLTGTGAAPLVTNVSMSTPTIDFGNVPVGSTVGPMNSVLTSSGTAPWMIGAIGSPTCYGGPICYGGPFSCTSTCTTGSQYSPGSSCQLDATFSPTAAGPWSVNVQICDNASGSPRTIEVKGNGIIPGSPSVAMSGTTLNFGPVALGTSSTTQTATFTSSGLQPWIITSKGSPTCYGGPICYGGGFTCATTCTPGTSYSQGQSCTIDAFFTPTTTGAQSVTVQFCDNAPGSPHTLILNAEGVPPPAVSLTPGAHDYGPVPVGSNGAPFTFKLSNPSPSALFIGNVVATAPFSIVSTTCTPSMGPSGSCDAVVGFTPSADGYVTGTVGPTAFPNVVASLVGRGLTSAQLVLPTAIDFPAYTLGQPALTRVVALKNSGQLPLTITNLSVSSVFTLTHNCPTTPMPPDASCIATLGFAPTTIGNFAGSFTVVSDAAGGTQSVPVRGSSQPRPAPSLLVTPKEVGFGGRGVGSLSPAQAVSIRNIGGAAAIIDSLVTSADFVVLGHNCATLAPLAECTASVAMQANSFGIRMGTLTIRSNSENGTETVLLSGTGCRPPGVSAGRLGASAGGC